MHKYYIPKILGAIFKEPIWKISLSVFYWIANLAIPRISLELQFPTSPAKPLCTSNTSTLHPTHP
jgi:hypothetical protein